MTIKSALFAAALGLSSLTFASAETYTVTLTQPVVAGCAQLSAGAYKINVDGHFVVFTNVETKKTVMAYVRKGVTPRPVEATTIEMKDENGARRIESIQLEDSVTSLEF